MYATRTADKIASVNDTDKLHDFSHTMRNGAFIFVIACWTLAFVIQISVIKLGVEYVSKVDLDLDGNGNEADEDEEGKDEDGEKEEIEQSAPPELQELAKPYRLTFKFFLYSLGYCTPWLHVALRNYFSYYVVTLLEVPVVINFFLLFTSAPKRWSERDLLFMAVPYLAFNAIVMIGDIISLALSEEGRPKDSYKNNIGGKLLTIACCVVFFPLVLDTSRRMKTAFSPKRTERFLNDVFSKAR